LKIPYDDKEGLMAKAFRTAVELDEYILTMPEEERAALRQVNGPYQDQLDAAAREGIGLAEEILGHKAEWVTHAGLVEWVRLGMLDSSEHNELYDVARGDFDESLCTAAELDPAMLAPVRPSTEVVGTLLPDIASELGLPSRCAVVVGTGDEHAASVGAGAIEPGVVVDVTGTAEPVTTVSAAPVRDPLCLVETHGHAVPGSWLIENPGFVSGGSTLWLAGLLGVPQAEVFTLALAAPPASDGVLFLPALSGSTAPRWNDRMRGGLLGLAMNHTQAHVARAVLEGCAYALRDIVERLDALGLGRGEIRIVGGGARDNLWATIKASVLGRPVRRVLTEEATAVGAAMVAGVGSGFFADFTAASVAVRLAPTAIDPDPEATKTYADAYRRYLAAFDAVESALARPDLSARPT